MDKDGKDLDYCEEDTVAQEKTVVSEVQNLVNHLPDISISKSLIPVLLKKEIKLEPSESKDTDIDSPKEGLPEYHIKTFEYTKPIRGTAPSMNVPLKTIFGPIDKHYCEWDANLFNAECLELLTDLEIEEEKFKDEKFKPDISSIIGHDVSQKRRKELEERFGNLQWLAPEEIFGGDHSIWKDSRVSDIDQGDLNNCYFLAALCSLAKYRQRLAKSYIVRLPNSQNLFCVFLCVAGIFEHVYVDGHFPCLGNKPCFNGSRQKELWAMIMEKAWAKIHGGYLNTEWGLLDEALHDLTGAPADYFEIKPDGPTRDNLWNILKDSLKEEFLVTCGTRDYNNKDEPEHEIIKNAEKDTGLVGTHAYSIHQVFTLVEEDGEKTLQLAMDDKQGGKIERIVQIQNPRLDRYENDEVDWKGKWNLKSEEFLKTLKPQLKKHGFPIEETFFMEYSDFCRFFKCFAVCKYKDGYYHSSQKFTTNCSKSPTIFRFKLTHQKGQKLKHFFTLSQMNSKMYPKRMKREYCPLSILLCRITSTGAISFIGSNGGAAKDVTIEAECYPGEYIAYVISSWKNENEHENVTGTLGISIYSPQPIQSVDLIAESDLPSDFIVKAMQEKSLKNKQQMKYFNDAKVNEPMIGYMLDHKPYEWGYFMVDNASKDTQVTAFLHFENTKDVFFRPSLEWNKAQLIARPNKMIFIAFQMRGHSELTIKESFHFVPHVSKCVKVVKQKGTPIPRLFKDSDVNINIYCLKTETLIIYLHSNDSSEYKYKETMKLTLKNAKIASADTQHIMVDLKPNSYRYTVIKKVDPTFPEFSADIFQPLDYRIRPVK